MLLVRCFVIALRTSEIVNTPVLLVPTPSLILCLDPNVTFPDTIQPAPSGLILHTFAQKYVCAHRRNGNKGEEVMDSRCSGEEYGGIRAGRGGNCVNTELVYEILKT